MGVVLEGTSRMTLPRNYTVLRADIIVDHAEPTKRLKMYCRKWARSFLIFMKSSTTPTSPSSKL
ncbi:hypothetical protein R6Q57_017876 [Mikania cordata]